MKREFALLMIFRLTLFVFVGMLGSLLPIIPLTFPYIDKLAVSGLPRWLYSWGNFDGVHYIGIAMQGYHQFDQAFFPLYPLLIRAMETYTHSYVMSGLVISHLCAIIGLWYAYKLVKEIWGSEIGYYSLLVLVAAPVSFYAGSLYAEGLFLLQMTVGMHFLRKRKWFVPMVMGFAAGLTKIQGVLLVIGYGAIMYELYARGCGIKKLYSACFSPVVGLMSYMAYLHFRYNDVLYFLHAQDSFGAERSSDFILLPQVLYRYVKIFMTADYSWAYGIAVLEFGMTLCALSACVWLMYSTFHSKNWAGFGIGCMGLAMVIMPPLTGTLSSMPRYIVPVLALPVAIAHFPSQTVKWGLIGASFSLQVLFALMFIQGRFVA